MGIGASAGIGCSCDRPWTGLPGPLRTIVSPAPAQARTDASPPPTHTRIIPCPTTAGESEADHRELVDFCRSFKFERMGCFQYSPEDGTPAAELPDQVWQ